MKTKLALLAVATIVGFSSTSAIAGRDWNYFPATPPKASAPAKPAFKSCCDTKTSYSMAPSGRGLQANKSIVCDTGCAAPHAGRNCTAAERTQCAN